MRLQVSLEMRVARKYLRALGATERHDIADREGVEGDGVTEELNQVVIYQ